MVQMLPAGAVTDGVQQAGANCPRPPGPATTGRGTPSRPRPAVSLLADRIAAALMLHDPGWRLPRPTALARHYHVTPAEVEMAMDELVSRRLVRRLPGDQLYRSSPAEYLIPLEGMASLGARVDPIGGKVTCVGSHASWPRVPEHISRALGVARGEPVCVVQLVWMSDGEPAALSTTYLAAHLAQSCLQASRSTAEAADGVLPLIPFTADGREPQRMAPEACRPGALAIEVQPPPTWVARRLRLTPGQPALLVTVRFDGTSQARPCAITSAALRTDTFRIALESPQPPSRTMEATFPPVWSLTVLGEGP